MEKQNLGASVGKDILYFFAEGSRICSHQCILAYIALLYVIYKW